VPVTPVVSEIVPTTSATSKPLQYKSLKAPLATATPVPALVFTVTANPPVLLFTTMYVLDELGTMRLRAAVSVSVDGISNAI
jgi:hypothetical protein